MYWILKITLAFLSLLFPYITKKSGQKLKYRKNKSILFSFKGLSAPRNPEIVSDAKVSLQRFFLKKFFLRPNEAEKK